MDPNARKLSAGPFEYLTKEQMREIHSAALEILEDLGTVVHHAEAVQLLKSGGRMLGKATVCLFHPH